MWICLVISSSRTWVLKTAFWKKEPKLESLPLSVAHRNGTFHNFIRLFIRYFQSTETSPRERHIYRFGSPVCFATFFFTTTSHRCVCAISTIVDKRKNVVILWPRRALNLISAALSGPIYILKSVVSFPEQRLVIEPTVYSTWSFSSLLKDCNQLIDFSDKTCCVADLHRCFTCFVSLILTAN